MSDNASNSITSAAYSPAEEWANTWSHGLGVLLSAVGCIFLIAAASQSGDAWVVTSVIIYGLSLLSLYLASTLYHGTSSAARKALMKTLDHCAIYLLIAGSYTPFLLIAMREGNGIALMVCVWTIAAMGIALKLRFPQRFKALRVSSYLLMGWLVVFSGSELIAALSIEGLVLLAVGGLVYTLGVIFYLVHAIPYNHAIWHGFVLGGSACHYFAIYLYLVPHSA